MTDHETEGGLPTNIGRPATGALVLAGYERLGQLVDVTEAELLALHGVGPKAVERLRHALATKGLAFAEADRDVG